MRSIERSGVGGVVIGHDRRGEPRSSCDFVSNLSDAKVGDRLVTSGLDSIFPRGITIGDLAKVEKGVGLYKKIWVTPAVDFAEVGAVLVVLDPPQIDRAVPDRRDERRGDAGRGSHPNDADPGGPSAGASGHGACRGGRSPGGGRRPRPPPARRRRVPRRHVRFSRRRRQPRHPGPKTRRPTRCPRRRRPAPPPTPPGSPPMKGAIVGAGDHRRARAPDLAVPGPPAAPASTSCWWS